MHSEHSARDSDHDPKIYRSQIARNEIYERLCHLLSKSVIIRQSMSGR